MHSPPQIDTSFHLPLRLTSSCHFQPSGRVNISHSHQKSPTCLMASLYTSILGSIVTKRYGLKKGEKGNKRRRKRKATRTIDASCSATTLVELVETELKSIHDYSGVAVASACFLHIDTLLHGARPRTDRERPNRINNRIVYTSSAPITLSALQIIDVHYRMRGGA